MVDFISYLNSVRSGIDQINLAVKTSIDALSFTVKLVSVKNRAIRVFECHVQLKVSESSISEYIADEIFHRQSDADFLSTFDVQSGCCFEEIGFVIFSFDFKGITLWISATFTALKEQFT